MYGGYIAYLADVPDNINPYDGKLIGDWAAGRQGIVVD